MTVQRLLDVCVEVYSIDNNALVDYSNQGMKFEGNFSKVTEEQRATLEEMEIGADSIHDTYIDIEVI